MAAKAVTLRLLRQDAGEWFWVSGMPHFYVWINLEWKVCMAVRMAFSQRRRPGLADTQPAVFKNKQQRWKIYFFSITSQQYGNYALSIWVVGIQGLQTNSLFPWGVFFAPGAEKGAGTLFNVTWEMSCSAFTQCYSFLLMEKWLGKKKSNTQEFFPAVILVHSYFCCLLVFFLFNFLKWFWAYCYVSWGVGVKGVSAHTS